MVEPTYWPFWLGGLSLGGVIGLHLLATRRQLAVSGILARLLRWSDDRKDQAREQAMEEGAFDDAILAATLERFGPEALEVLGGNDSSGTTKADIAPVCGTSTRIRLPISSGAVFIVALAIGGLAAQSLVSVPDVAFSLDPHFQRLVGGGPTGFFALFAGGILVGFGARMAGGCTSGHGLCGVARFQPGSLVTTGSLFAAGILTSLVLELWK
jgi:hypothetical protein